MGRHPAVRSNDRVMADEFGEWAPLSVVEVARLLTDAPYRWWIAGGWAIDLFVGRQTRPHGDVDVLVLRDDLLPVQATLAEWDLHAADPPGTLRPWRPEERLPAPVHDVWCRQTPSSPWALQLMVADTDGDRWVFRRDPRITRSVSELTRETTDGVPYLAPEIQLLFKAKSVSRPKDEDDFATALPHLDRPGRAWLARALEVCAPAHRWLAQL
jgi:hypothetical protein